MGSREDFWQREELEAQDLARWREEKPAPDKDSLIGILKEWWRNYDEAV